MQENLLGYLLGALDADEHEAVRQQLEREAQLRRELTEIENRLAPLERQRWERFEPPSGLAVRTCQMLAEHSSDSAARRPSPAMSRSIEPPRAGGSWSLVDMVITAGILAALACLFLPTIAKDRYTAELLTCQDHLRELSQGLLNYDPSPNKSFPSPLATAGVNSSVLVPGIFASHLSERGCVKNPKCFFCPSIPSTGQNTYHIPGSEDVRNASAKSKAWAALSRVYAYNIGYIDDNNVYHPPRNLGRSHFPIVADRPTYTNVGPVNAGHHGMGLNVLMEDGSVRRLPSGTCQIGGDNIFLNDDGQIRPGTHVDDAVVVPPVRRVALIVRVKGPATIRFVPRARMPERGQSVPFPDEVDPPSR